MKRIIRNLNNRRKDESAIRTETSAIWTSILSIIGVGFVLEGLAVDSAAVDALVGDAVGEDDEVGDEGEDPGCCYGCRGLLILSVVEGRRLILNDVEGEGEVKAYLA